MIYWYLINIYIYLYMENTLSNRWSNFRPLFIKLHKANFSFFNYFWAHFSGEFLDTLGTELPIATKMVAINLWLSSDFIKLFNLPARRLNVCNVQLATKSILVVVKIKQVDGNQVNITAFHTPYFFTIGNCVQQLSD